jgi:hypothetical protein
MNLESDTERILAKSVLRETSSLSGKQKDYVDENWLSGAL